MLTYKEVAAYLVIYPFSIAQCEVVHRITLKCSVKLTHPVKKLLYLNNLLVLCSILFHFLIL